MFDGAYSAATARENSVHVAAMIRKYTANIASDATTKPRVNIQRTDGSVRLNIASGSPNDHRMRSSSPRNSVGRLRRRRSARMRSSSTVVRSASVRSSRPMDASFRANPSTARAVSRTPSAASAAAISSGVRLPSKYRMTPISTGRKRKYFCVAGSFTTKLVSPRKTCSTMASSGRRRGPPAPLVSAMLLIANATSPRHDRRSHDTLA